MFSLCVRVEAVLQETRQEIICNSSERHVVQRRKLAIGWEQREVKMFGGRTGCRSGHSYKHCLRVTEINNRTSAPGDKKTAVIGFAEKILDSSRQSWLVDQKGRAKSRGQRQKTAACDAGHL